MYVSRASSKLGSIPLAWRNRTVTKTVKIASQANSGLAVNAIFTSENNVLSSVDFYKINFFEKNISGISSACKTVCLQIRLNVLSGLIWVQTVCKGCQLTTLVTMRFVCITVFPKCYNISK